MEDGEKSGRDRQTLVTVLRKEAEGRAFDEMEGATGARARAFEAYNRPCDRNRVTGSTTGIACRRKIQRATANPIAA